MPIYSYKCETCEEIEDNVFLRIMEGIELKECPLCGGISEKISVYEFSARYGKNGSDPDFYTNANRGITGKKRKPKVKVGSVYEDAMKNDERASDYRDATKKGEA